MTASALCKPKKVDGFVAQLLSGAVVTHGDSECTMEVALLAVGFEAKL